MKNARGQAMVELALVLPLAIVLVLGVVEVSYLVLDQHVVTKLTREGSNLISRDTSLADAALAMKSMSTRPVDFTKSSKLIFSVVKRVSTTGAANYNKDVLYQRYQYGAIAATSQLSTSGSGSFGGAPDYIANNSDSDTRLQVTNLPPNLLTTGGMLYITEIFTKHTLLTPFAKFGITVPDTLYSIAYF
jgi:Flp pilus assembly protein TadG